MSLDLHALHFLRPQWLWALLALPPLWGLWRARRGRANVWRRAVDAHLLPHLLDDGGKPARVAVWLGALGCALAILALAGPSWRRSEQPLWRTQAPLVVALDLSSATGAADLPPSRLLQARAKLAALLNERSGGQVALVAYAGDAFTVAPLTDDAGNAALFLDALDPSIMPTDGQDAARAIEWSAKLLKQGGFARGDILLLTDHADAAADAAAGRVARDGFRVSALGLGTPAGAAYRTSEGGIARASLDAPSLRALASAGAGRYAALTGNDDDLRALGLLDPRQTDAESQQGEKRKSWEDDGYWLLPPLMLLGLLAFRRGGAAVAALALCALLPLSAPARAAEGGSWWRRADQQRHAQVERGADAYRKGDFAAAEKAFSGIDSADALYDRGNALAKQGRYDDAIAAYDAALRRQPGMADAIANRKAVEEARKRQNSNGGQGARKQGPSGRNGQQDQGQGQGDNGSPQPQGRQQGSSGAQDSRQDSQSPQPQKDGAQKDAHQPPPSGSPSQDARPADAKAEDKAKQQAADAAQRERMRQAMQDRPKPGEGRDGEGKRAGERETEAERERRQAVEAWLRRVPDDPGGLLRAKFRIEYERRQREGR